MRDDGLKSVNVKNAPEDYYIIDIPSKKKRVFLDSDYTVLSDILSGPEIEKYYEEL